MKINEDGTVDLPDGAVPVAPPKILAQGHHVWFCDYWMPDPEPIHGSVVTDALQDWARGRDS